MPRWPDTRGMEDPALARAIITYTAERERTAQVVSSTAYRMRWELLRFARHCGQPPKRVNVRHVEKYLATKRSLGSRRTALSDLKGFCAWALLRGVLRSDPTAGVRLPKPAKATPRSLTEEQAQAVVAQADNARNRLIVLLMLNLGLRAKEVAELELGDVDLRRRWMHVRGKGGRGGVTRTLPIPDEALRAIQAYLSEHPATAGPLVRSFVRPGLPLAAHGVTDIVTRLFWAAGIKQAANDGRSGHGLRHTCLTDLADLGAPLEVIQEIAGHEDPKTTQHYISGHRPELRQWIEGRKYGPV